MTTRNVLYIVIVILLVYFASTFWVHKNVKNGEVCHAPIIKQKAKQVAPPILKKTDINDQKVTFIELGSVGCAPCNMMAPILDEIEKEYKGRVNVIFYDIRSPLGGPYAEKYRIQLIPTQVFLDKDGIEYYRHIGFFPKEEIVKILQLRGVK